MASRKEYEMLFQLNAQLNGGFNSTFSNAQQQLASMQREIQALNRTQSDIAAYQKQQSAVEATKQKLEVLQQQYDNIQKEIKETEGYSSSLENKLLSKQQQIDKTSTSLQQQTDKLNQMDSALKSAGVDTSNLAKESATLTTKIDDLKSKQEEAAEGAHSFGEKSANAFGAVQEAIVAAGIAASLKEIYDAYMDCVDIAADFEETMSTVEALSGSSSKEMDQLSSLAKELGATTKFTAIESGEAMTYMGMAGWKAGDMLSGMDGVLQLAAASGEDLAMVSDIVTDNLTAFGLKASDTAHFSDVLAAAATNSNTSVSIMGETFKNSAALAGALNYSIEDVAVAVGLMANAGIKGSNAGTALKNVFTGLLDGVTLTAEAFGEVDYSVINTDGTMKSFSETINDLRGYFEQMTGAEKMQNAETIAGMRAMAGFVSIMNSTDEDYAALTESINNCSGAASKMASIKLDNLKGELTLMNSAADALKTTLGEQFNAELRTLYKTGTSLFGLLNSFVQAHPGLTKGIITFVAVMGAAVAVLTAYAAITKIVIPLMQLFTASIPGVGIIMGVAAGVAALTGVIVGLTTAAKKEAEQFENLTATSRKQKEEIVALKSEYEALCEAGQETSDRAYYLEYRIDSLTESYEAQKQTVEEYIAQCEELNQSLNDSLDTSRKTVKEADINEARTQALITRLAELAGQTDKTAASQEEMKTIVAELNELLPNVAFSYEDIKNGMGEIEQLLKNEATARANLEKAEKSRQAMMEADKSRTEAKKQLEDLHNQYNIELEDNKQLEESYNKLKDSYYGWIHSGGRGTNPYEAYYKEAKRAYEASQEALAAYQTQIEETNDTVTTAQSDYDAYLKELVETSGVTIESIDAMTELDGAIATASLSMQDLAANYELAYFSAYASFSGQFDLFDNAKANMDSTVSAAQTALDSQLKFWQTYADNINVLRGISAEDLGVTQENYDAIIAYASEGTEEAAGFAQSLANAVNSGNTEAISKLANTVGEVKAAREKAAGEVTAWQLDFDGKMKEIVQTMETSLKDMDMSDEATAAAASTMNAYAESISTQGATAVSNALSIANQVKAQLQKANTTVTIKVKKVEDSGTGYATGTDYATPGAHWVGENGPELLWFSGGEKVLDAKKSAALMKDYSEAAEMQIISLSPALMSAMSALQRQETIAATPSNGQGYRISIAPVFNVRGGDTEDMEAVMQRCSAMLVDNVIDVLNEAGIDAKRGAYA